MSEKLGPPVGPETQTNPADINLPSNPMAEGLNDAGMVRPGELAGTFTDLVSRGVDMIGDAWQQHVINSAQRKIERAGTTLEKMDHKDGLYKRLGAMAIGGEEPAPFSIKDANEAQPRPRTAVERFMDKRLEKRTFKHEYREAQRERTIKVYGAERSNTSGIGTRIVRELRNRSAEEQYRQGDLTARELRERRFDIATTPAKFSNPEQRRTKRQAREAGVKLDRAAGQPILSRWRAARRRRAIGQIQKSWEKLNSSQNS